MALELVPLCTAELQLLSPILIPGTPSGTRVIVPVATGRYKGDRLNGSVKGSMGADWLSVGPDGLVGTLDVRGVLETDDGADVFVHYLGRKDMRDLYSPIYATPLFDTGDERYAWLNLIQAVAKGTVNEDLTVLTYEMYELR